jgi:dihydrofolate synthase/folylpolyglutamate synthase
MIATYRDALDYIESFSDPARQPALSNAEASRNVARMAALLAAIGEPQRALRSVIVAGTKGKGSSCALIERMLRAAGYRTGLWSSPHLNSYRERIQVDRQLITPAELAAAAHALQPIIDGFDPEPFGRPSSFDVGFLLALHHFAQRGVELAVLEVGVGGRYDCVNALRPLVSVISSISYDHQHIQGPTLGSIAWNKAGIMKAGVPAVSAPQWPAAAAELRREARAVSAPLWVAQPWGLARAARGAGQEQPTLAYPVEPRPGRLRGVFQQENGRLALGAAMLLREQGLHLPDAALAEGLAEATWPGRMELVGRAPLLVLDGAHNGDSAAKLALALRAEFSFERLILVLGTSRDKDIEGIAAGLVPHADQLILTRSAHHRALADLDALAAAVQPHLRGELAITHSVEEALALARRLARPSDLICLTGSLFVVGAARAALGLAEIDAD